MGQAKETEAGAPENPDQTLGEPRYQFARAFGIIIPRRQRIGAKLILTGIDGVGMRTAKEQVGPCPRNLTGCCDAIKRHVND
jgi:hypothetical protein